MSGRLVLLLGRISHLTSIRTQILTLQDTALTHTVFSREGLELDGGGGGGPVEPK